MRAAAPRAHDHADHQGQHPSLGTQARCSSRGTRESGEKERGRGGGCWVPRGDGPETQDEGFLYRTCNKIAHVPPLHEELSLISEPTPTATRVVPFPVLQVASFPARPCTQYTRRRTQEAHRPNRGWMGQLGCTVCHKQAHTAPSVAPSPPPSLLVSLWLVLPLCFAKTHPPPPRRACFHPSHTKTALKIFLPPG